MPLGKMDFCETSFNSPQLQPTRFKQDGHDDVRSLLYCSSDSEEIESLVFNQAEQCLDGCAHECESIFKREDFSELIGFAASEDSWSTSNSQNLAQAFECEISLLHHPDCAGQTQFNCLRAALPLGE